MHMSHRLHLHRLNTSYCRIFVAINPSPLLYAAPKWYVFTGCVSKTSGKKRKEATPELTETDLSIGNLRSSFPELK